MFARTIQRGIWPQACQPGNRGNDRSCGSGSGSRLPAGEGLLASRHRCLSHPGHPASRNWRLLGIAAMGKVKEQALRISVFLFRTSSLASPQPHGAPSTHITNIFAPASTPARAIYDLSLFVLAVTAVIFVVFGSLLVYSIVKFRGRAADADREPAQVYGSTQIELAWTVIPVLIVVVLFLATARVIHALQDARKPPTAVEVVAIGHQFWWEFHYLKFGIVPANELHVPVSNPPRSVPTYLKLLSADTDHSFWIPELAGKTDLIPNRVNEMWMDPERPGTFLGQCAQYCGTQHAKMLLRVIVQSADDFAAWGPGQQPPALQDERVATGRRVFETTACINCHAIEGTVANGRFGPDLTHMMSRQTIASGATEKTRANLRLWVG